MDVTGKRGVSWRVTLAVPLPVLNWRVSMPSSQPVPEIADEVPWADGITEYDNRLHDTYLQLLDADNDGIGKDEMARRIFGIEPDKEPERARKVVASHLARARWMSRVGYRYLAAGQYAGGDSEGASQLGLLRLLGLMTTPPDGGTGR